MLCAASCGRRAGGRSTRVRSGGAVRGCGAGVRCGALSGAALLQHCCSAASLSLQRIPAFSRLQPPLLLCSPPSSPSPCDGTGLTPALAGNGLAWGIYFFAYNRAKERYRRYQGGSGGSGVPGKGGGAAVPPPAKLSPGMHLLSAAEAGAMVGSPKRLDGHGLLRGVCGGERGGRLHCSIAGMSISDQSSH